ncbi:MAG: hypothetical protein WBX81_07680 [Nitrososphaeraceae archaeon]
MRWARLSLTDLRPFPHPCVAVPAIISGFLVAFLVAALISIGAIIISIMAHIHEPIK